MQYQRVTLTLCVSTVPGQKLITRNADWNVWIIRYQMNKSIRATILTLISLIIHLLSNHIFIDINKNVTIFILHAYMARGHQKLHTLLQPIRIYLDGSSTTEAFLSPAFW